MATFNDLGIEEKKLLVEHFDDLDNIPLECLPDSVDSAEEEGYYFVSYSRADYKAVYKDLFGFQKLGSVEIDGKQVPLRFFYDRRYAINSGENWEKIANEFILPQPCKGVIFYISENSLRSEAIAKEMKFAKEHLKQVITVILHDDKELNAIKYLDILIKNEQDEKKLAKLENKRQIMSGFITDSTTYLNYSADITFKAKSIANNLTGLPLLNIIQYTDRVESVNNILVRKIDERDFCFYEDQEGKICTATCIDECAFANCKKLETVILPSELTTIAPYAFFNCVSLKNISIPNSVDYIGKFAFFHCYELEEIRLPQSLSSIQEETFFGCFNLRIVTIPQTVEFISGAAFAECINLKHIWFGGTRKQWIYMSKGYLWDDCTGDYIVHCTDGCIAKEGEFVIDEDEF